MRNSTQAANDIEGVSYGEIPLELGTNINMSYEEIAKELNLTVKEVKAAEASALKKMRHPKVGKIFKEYLAL